MSDAHPGADTFGRPRVSRRYSFRTGPMRLLLACVLAASATGCMPGTLGSIPGAPDGVRLIDAGVTRDDAGRPIPPIDPLADGSVPSGRDAGPGGPPPGTDAGPTIPGDMC